MVRKRFNMFDKIKSKKILVTGGVGFIGINLIKRLLEHKAKIVAHDPMAIENTRKIMGNKISYTKSISEALKDSQCVVIMTPWKQYTKLNNKDLKLMKNKIIIDTRRLLTMKKLDAKYYAVGLGFDI